jgi:hypothetical protein
MEMIVIQNSPLRLSSASFIPDRHRFPARPVWSGSVCDMRPDFGTRVKMHNISRPWRERTQVYHSPGGIVQDSPGFFGNFGQLGLAGYNNNHELREVIHCSF